MGDQNNKSSHATSEDTKTKGTIKGQGSRPDFSEDEESLIARMFNLVGERWSLIAGRIPGRTAEEIEKYWTSRYSSSSTER
ncbi:hypothetical protein JCGZ_21218 [Jatropha curcas]|uniref:Uncharacterized protein n=1 Tax=Jatropha curcas TaxID=180498 RepID=A0A067JAH2_JATCU|nr:transcription factor CPC [Jatropha curcas]KDP20747.1 hypothetical protein JCGZ_21218 [Jatropha curcas]